MRVSRELFSHDRRQDPVLNSSASEPALRGKKEEHSGLSLPKFKLKVPSKAQFTKLLSKTPLVNVYFGSSAPAVDQSPAETSSKKSARSVRSRAVSNASSASLGLMTLSKFTSHSSLSVYDGLKSTLGYARDRVLGETESGVAFNEFDDEEDGSSADCGRSTMLPYELMLELFQHMDDKTLTTCERLNSTWYDIANTNSVWRSRFRENHLWSTVECIPDDINWKKLYKIRAELDRRWKNGSYKAVSFQGHKDSIYCVQFDDEKIITGSRDQTIRVWCTRTGKALRTVSRTSSSTIGHTRSILCLKYDDQVMITGSSDCTCILWDIKTFKPLGQFFRHNGGVLDVALNDNYIVSCSKDSRICVWDRSSPKYSTVVYLTGHQGPVNAVDIRGDIIVSAGGDSTVRVWSVSQQLCVRVLQGHTRGLACVHISEDGKYIASGSNDNTIRVWDLETGACIHVLHGHVQLVRSIFIFNDTIVSGSYDQTIKIWNLTTGELLKDIIGLHGSWVFSTRADIKRIVTTSMGVRPVVMDYSYGLDEEYLGFIHS
ncbi:hypothetical protein TRVA0_050S00430 [Trichomonascus vanleenenianus]|uniref:F-box/WD repeat-containing protein n=1 Tax=Trichomonascus vanleenenianus TaxID=2268995 RepID=UPI003ECB341E